MTDSVEARWERHNEAGKRLLAADELPAAEQAFIAAVREATLLGADNERLATSLSHLGQIKTRQKDLTQAEALFRRALAIRERVLGKDHVSLVPAINNLASVQAAAGNVTQAEPLFARALELSDRYFGPHHASAAAPLNSLARILFRRSDFAAAAPLLTRLLAIKEEALGANHPEVAAILTSLARVRTAEGDYASAEQLARRALAIREQTQSEGSPIVATSLDTLAEICAARGKPDEATQLRERAQAIRGPSAPPASPFAPPASLFAPAPRVPERPADRKLTPPFVRQVSRFTRRTPPPRDSLPWIQPPASPASPASSVPAAPVTLADQPIRRTSAPLFAATTSSSTGSMSAIMVPLGAADIFASPSAPASRSRSVAEPLLRAEPVHRADTETTAAVALPADPIHVAPGSAFDADAKVAESAMEPSFRIRRMGVRAPQWLTDPRRPWLKAVALASVLVIVGASAWALTQRSPGTRGAAASAPPTAPVVQREQSAALAVPPQSVNPPVAAPTEADRMATATMPVEHDRTQSATAPRASAPHAASDPQLGKGQAESATVPELPRIKSIERVTNAIGERATDRADSLGRTITIKPPTFGKP